jgi:fatty-acyl-CoA synthase
MERAPSGASILAADPEAPVMHSSIGAVLRERASRQEGHDALRWLEGDDLKRITYGELLGFAEEMGRRIAHIAAPGSVVAVWGKNGPEWVIAEYACALSGTILCGFNTAWTNHELAHAIELTEPALLLVDDDPRGADLLPRAATFAGGTVVARLHGFRTDGARPMGTLPETTPDMPFLIQFTSGTTGRAKGALLTHAAALNGGLLRVSGSDVSPDDVFLNASPLHHVAGSVSLVLGSLVAGATYVVVERFNAERVLAMIRLTGATSIGGVPTVLRDVLNRPEFPAEGYRLSRVGLGGSMVPEELVRRVSSAFHAPVSVGYGQSECPLICNSTIGDPPEIIATTVGRPVAQNSVKIADRETGDPVALGEVGEICVRSPAGMSGYYRMPEATAEVIDAEGWLHTGDLGSMDAEGFVRVLGRSRDVIMRGGQNIYPAEIEDALALHPAVAAAVAIGLPDERLGQTVAGVVRLKDGCRVEAKELEAFLAERVAYYKLPRSWRFVEGFPMTASGKIRKVELPSLFEAGLQETDDLKA